MKESKPLDLEEIRVRAVDYEKYYLVSSCLLKHLLAYDIPALCAEVESLRKRV